MRAPRLTCPVRNRLDYQRLVKVHPRATRLASLLHLEENMIHQEMHLAENKGDTKMKTLKTMLLTVSAVAVLGSTLLSAQTKATASIPFEFWAQNTTLPAGEYTLERLSPSSQSDVLLIRNVETRKAITMLAPGNVSEYKGDKSVVLFHRIGDRYFLAEVKTEAVRGHVSPSKWERELASEGNGQPMAAVIIPALSVR
jgi:hypothetical protein